jgi:hypothetical protein
VDRRRCIRSGGWKYRNLQGIFPTMGLATFKYSDAVNKYENTCRQVLRPIHRGRRESPPSQPSQFRIGRRWSMHYCGAGFTVRPSAEGCHVARPEFSPIGEDGGSATPTSLAPSWRRPWPDPRAKAFCRRRASSGSRADASRSSLKMRWPCGVRTGTTKTELMLRTYQPKLESRNRPQVIAVQAPSIPKAGQYRRRQADVICRCATPLLGRVTLCVSMHHETRESQSGHLWSPDCPP